MDNKERPTVGDLLEHWVLTQRGKDMVTLSGKDFDQIMSCLSECIFGLQKHQDVIREINYVNKAIVTKLEEWGFKVVDPSTKAMDPC